MFKQKATRSFSYRSSAFILLCLPWFLYLFFMVGCKKEGVAAGDQYNLLMIVIDTMRADRIGAYGYDGAETPNIDRLARGGIMFENCTTAVPLTLPSHCTLFTGKYPFTHGVRTNGRYVLDGQETTLAEALKERGFATAAGVAAFVLHSKFGLAQGFDDYDDSLDSHDLYDDINTEIPADKVAEKFNRRLQTDYRPDRRFFYWLHFFDPHTPYAPPDQYKARFPDAPYDGEVAYVDHQIGRVLDMLEEKNALDNTIVVLLGDHGEGFGEHKERGHGIFCYEETLRVPLIFYNPKLWPKGKQIEASVGLVDVMPSLLDIFAIQKPDGLQGESFIPLLSGSGGQTNRPPLYFETMHGKEELGFAPLTGLIKNGYKYISLPRAELYHLKQDPAEKTNLFLRENKLAKQMDAQLAQIIAGHGGDRPGTTPQTRQLTGQDKKKLQSLGYISPFSAKSTKMVDPKEGIHMLEALTKIEGLLATRDLGGAEKALTDFAATYPGPPSAWLYNHRVTLHRLQGNYPGAIETALLAAAQYPEDTTFKLNLALLHWDKGDLPGAEKWCRKLLKQDPTHTRAHILAARVAARRGQTQSALTHYGKALEADPKNALVRREYADTLSGLGLSHLGRGDFTGGGKLLDQALEIDPQNAGIHNTLGKMHLGLFAKTRGPQHLEKAGAAFREAQKIDPKMADVYNNLGTVYRFSGQAEEAARCWQEGIRLGSPSPSPYVNLGMLYIATGQNQKAIDILNRCKEIFYQKMPPPERQRLDQLLDRARDPKYKSPPTCP